MQAKHNLTKFSWTEVVKQNLSHELDGNSLAYVARYIKDLIQAYGENCEINFDWYYQDLNIQVLKQCEESDEDFNKRVEEYLIQKENNRVLKERQKKLEKFAKQQEQQRTEQEERKLYEQLKAKYGE